ncbi:hypothetical protein Bca4012_007019 [Brassica carinata]
MPTNLHHHQGLRSKSNYALFDLAKDRKEDGAASFYATLLRVAIDVMSVEILGAPALQDNFYLNLVDWSAQNVLAVGLGNCMYLWNGCSSKVTKLCDLGADDSVCSVGWAFRGTHGSSKEGIFGQKLVLRVVSKSTKQFQLAVPQWAKS